MSSSEDMRQEQRPRLVRTRRGRLIGGVCSGLGLHFGVDPIVLRIVFVGGAFFAGIGIWLYLAILLLVPEEGASRAPIRLGRTSWRMLLGGAVVVAAVAVLLPRASRAALSGGWAAGVAAGAVALAGALGAAVWLRLRRRAPDEQPSADRVLASRLGLALALVALAALLGAAGATLAGTERVAAAWTAIALGACLIVSAFAGRRAHVLLLPALAFALPAAIFAAARVDLHGGLGERAYRPSSLSQLRGDYQLGAGRLEVDLRGVSFPAGVTTLHLRLGVGELVVLVPDQVCVTTRARMGGGFVGALDRSSGGLDVNWSNSPSPPSRVPRLVLEGSVGMGALFVLDRPLVGRFQAGAFGRNEACRQPLAVSAQ